MTFTLPSIVSSKYLGTVADFRATKMDRSGAQRNEYFTATIPISTLTGVYVGLVPFNKGWKLSYGSKFYIANVGDGSFTFDLGYLYYDSATGSSQDQAFGTAITTGQAGGLITFDENAGLSWTALGDGWIVLKTGGSTTDAAGVIEGQAVGSYDTGA